MKFKLSAMAALFAFAPYHAMAADLGGNCCADLEERVAELEATTADKGNRRVSLTVSGHVHEAIFAFDVDSDDDSVDGSNVYIGTHNSSRSRFRFRGDANINADWSAGFFMEFGVRRNALNATSQDDAREDAGIDIRHEALYVKSKTLGTIWLGHTSSAIDGITEICLGCAIGNASPDYSVSANNLLATRNFPEIDLAALTVSAVDLTFRNAGSASGFFPGEGDRRNMIKWISPTVGGFSLSASWGGDDFWDAALRYAGEFGSIRVGAGIGYSQTTNGADDAGVSSIGCNSETAESDRDCTTLGASVSAMHVPSGVYFRGSWGQNKNELAVVTGTTDEGWEITAGISKKWNSLGKTNIWALYGVSERTIGLLNGSGELEGVPVDVSFSNELTTYGFGLQQNIDAAAMEVYIWYRHYEGESTFDARIGNSAILGTGQAEADVITAGARVRF